MKNDFHYAAELIRNADGILITAGAGMSVDSGLPDFRSVGDCGMPAHRSKNLICNLCRLPHRLPIRNALSWQNSSTPTA